MFNSSYRALHVLLGRDRRSASSRILHGRHLRNRRLLRHQNGDRERVRPASTSASPRASLTGRVHGDPGFVGAFRVAH